MNIIITNSCNLQCPYCFAKKVRTSTDKKSEMKLAIFKKLMEYLKNEGEQNVQIMGGEPTCHSKFEEIIEYLLKGNWHIELLSNGTWNTKTRNFLKSLPPHRIGYMINLNHPQFLGKTIWDTTRQNLASLVGENVSLSLNIDKVGFRYEHIIEAIKEFGFTNVRWSLAHPILNQAGNSLLNNRYVRTKDYSKIAPQVYCFISDVNKTGAYTNPDCTVPYCFFTPRQFKHITLNNTNIIPSRSCNGAFDITPSLEIARCFSLSQYERIKLDFSKPLQPQKEALEGRLSNYKYCIYPWDKCKKCKYAKPGLCRGVCYAHLIVKSPNRIGTKKEKISEKSLSYDDIPVLAKGAIIKDCNYNFKKDCFECGKHNTIVYKRAGNLYKLLEPPIDAFAKECNGRKSIRQILKGLSFKGKPSMKWGSWQKEIKCLISQEIIQLLPKE